MRDLTMSSNDHSLFEGFLRQHDQRLWWAIVSELLPSIHEVDRRATKIWFSFWPLWLAGLTSQAEHIERLERELELKGNYRLAEQIDTSHGFLYGHRYWPHVKRAIAEHAGSSAAPGSLDLGSQMRRVASETAARIGLDPSLLVGITAVGFMTLQQVGLPSFAASPGSVRLGRWARRRSPERVLRSRRKKATQGLFGFLKGLKREFTIRFDENHKSACFRLIDSLELTTASMTDPRQHAYADPRCKPGEGPIPTECRSAACGTCWVGVIAGARNLSEIRPLEARRIKRFGYSETNELRPIIRLACKAKASGPVTLAIPPWNGVFGRYLENKRIAIGGGAAAADEETVARPRRH